MSTPLEYNIVFSPVREQLYDLRYDAAIEYSRQEELGEGVPVKQVKRQPSEEQQTSARAMRDLGRFI